MKINPDIKIQWNEGIKFIDYLSVVKDAPNRDSAMKFLNFFTQPKNQAVFTEIVGYQCSNAKSIDYLPKDLQMNMPTHPANWDKMVWVFSDENIEWIVDHTDEFNEKWNEWISK